MGRSASRGKRLRYSTLSHTPPVEATKNVTVNSKSNEMDPANVKRRREHFEAQSSRCRTVILDRGLLQRNPSGTEWKEVLRTC